MSGTAFKKRADDHPPAPCWTGGTGLSPLDDLAPTRPKSDHLRKL